MASVTYGISRNVDATDEHGQPCKIALAVIEHENGTKQTLAIPEALIAYAGETIIDEEVRRAAASPSDAQFRKPIKLPRH